MNRLLRRIEKVEKNMQLIEEKANEKKARLLEIEKLGNDDSIEALMLKVELQHGSKLSIFDILALVGIQSSKISCIEIEEEQANERY
jgi:hypothetical protein